MSAPSTALKKCTHDGSEHMKNINGYWICKACVREKARDRRAGGPGRGCNNSAKTHCPKKHEYTPENTILEKGWKKGKRRACRKCAQAHMRRVVIKQYGITPEQYDAMLAAQDGRCAICREEFIKTPHIDHDHSCCPGRKACGECVRGLLCGDCNKLLGYAHDLPDVLRSALEYVEAYKRKTN